jgi:hypothetical protein
MTLDADTGTFAAAKQLHVILRKMRSRLTHMENQNMIFWFGALKESVAQS